MTYPGKRDLTYHEYRQDDKFLHAAFAKRKAVIISDHTGSNAFNDHFKRQNQRINELLKYFNAKDHLGWVSIGHEQQSIDLKTADISTKSAIFETIESILPYGFGSFKEAINKAYEMLNEYEVIKKEDSNMELLEQIQALTDTVNKNYAGMNSTIKTLTSDLDEVKNLESSDSLKLVDFIEFKNFFSLNLEFLFDTFSIKKIIFLKISSLLFSISSYFTKRVSKFKLFFHDL